MNKLPKNWLVRHDGSKEFYDHVIKYMNSIVKNTREIVRGTCVGDYYGVSDQGFFGSKNTITSDACKKNTKYFTIYEFINLSKEEWAPQRGDMVEVSMNDHDYVKRIFISKIDGAKQPYLCVDEIDGKRFREGETFNTFVWLYIRKIEEPKTLEIKSSEAFEIIAKAKGVDKSLIKIVE